ncbi:MAG: hypothetical protein WBL07_17120 [Thiothrix litoralis]|uniref:hypothetical protein n=1 Tax=Thiothrix litoralis TaxID=2891210 RepID=UPI003C737FF3
MMQNTETNGPNLMNIPPSHKIVLILLAVAMPGGALLLLFPKQAENLMSDMKSRIHRYRKSRQQSS